MREEDRIVLQALQKMIDTLLTHTPVYKALQESSLPRSSQDIVEIARRFLAQELEDRPQQQLEADYVLAHFEELLKRLFE